MNISASLNDVQGKREISLRPNDVAHSIDIPLKASGSASSVNGGELLFLALATCYGNNIYRKAEKRQMSGIGVEMTVIVNLAARENRRKM